MKEASNRSRFSKFVLGTALVGALICGSSSVAYAATNYGSYKTDSAHGINYKFRSWVQNSPKSGGGSILRTTSGGSPGGWMGESAYLRKSSTGAICKSSGVGYNSAGVTAYTRSATGTCGAGDYYTESFAYMYNSSGNYDITVAYNSPRIHFS